VDIPPTVYGDNGVDLTQVTELKVVGDGTVFIDNLYFHSDVNLPPVQPTAGAPRPMADADTVLFIFSDSCDDLAGTDFNPGWGQATAVMQADGMLKYANLNYQGTQFAGTDVSAYTFVHIDYTGVGTRRPWSSSWSGGDSVIADHARR
jgi:hypothetical protein